jgi:hypothetical protein
LNAPNLVLGKRMLTPVSPVMKSHDAIALSKYDYDAWSSFLSGIVQRGDRFGVNLRWFRGFVIKVICVHTWNLQNTKSMKVMRTRSSSWFLCFFLAFSDRL